MRSGELAGYKGARWGLPQWCRGEGSLEEGAQHLCIVSILLVLLSRGASGERVVYQLVVRLVSGAI